MVLRVLLSLMWSCTRAGKVIGVSGHSGEVFPATLIAAVHNIVCGAPQDYRHVELDADVCAHALIIVKQ